MFGNFVKGGCAFGCDCKGSFDFALQIFFVFVHAFDKIFFAHFDCVVHGEGAICEHSGFDKTELACGKSVVTFFALIVALKVSDFSFQKIVGAFGDHCAHCFACGFYCVFSHVIKACAEFDAPRNGYGNLVVVVFKITAFNCQCADFVDGCFEGQALEFFAGEQNLRVFVFRNNGDDFSVFVNQEFDGRVDVNGDVGNLVFILVVVHDDGRDTDDQSKNTGSRNDRNKGFLFTGICCSRGLCGRGFFRCVFVHF